MEPTTGTVPLDVSDVEAIRDALRRADPEGRLRPMSMRSIEIGTDAIFALPRVVGELTRGPDVALLMDETPIARGSRLLRDILLELLGERFAPRLHVLGESGASVHADSETIEQTCRVLAGAELVVVAGSGTVTDIGKEASRLLGLPLVAVQTAAAVNAFSDDMAVLLQSGVKRTARSKWPDALVADLTVIAGAPVSMTLAGFGDMAGLGTAPADWYLASAVGLDDSYHPAPLALLRESRERLEASAPGLKSRDLAAVDSLTRMLTISGISLGVAGSTAPMSGTEHLISHLLDLDAEVHGRAAALHGAQVGVASVVAAAIWEVGLEDLETTAPVLAVPPADAVERDVRAAFDGLDPTGRVGEECWRDCREKLSAFDAHTGDAVAAMSDWETHREVLTTMLAPPEQIAESLRTAGAVTGFDELSPAVSPAALRWAVRTLPFIRKRFTVADLLYYGGRWSEDLVERALVRSSKAGVTW
jgi:glycerol-1-phosphate dehydrogenase [NAD(P)+]